MPQNKGPTQFFVPNQKYQNLYQNYYNYYYQQQMQRFYQNMMQQEQRQDQPPQPPLPPQQSTNRQRLMEQSGITITPPQRNFDTDTSIQMPSQFGISIIPRDKTGADSASLQIGDKNFTSSSHRTQLPHTFYTSSGSALTIGRASDLPKPVVSKANSGAPVVQKNYYI